MIHHTSTGPLADQDLMGRYVMFERGYAYPSWGETLRVTKVTGSRVEGEEPLRRYDQALARWVLVLPNETLKADAMTDDVRPNQKRSRSGIKVVCDTPEEVNQVLAMGDENRVLFAEFEKDAVARVVSINRPK